MISAQSELNMGERPRGGFAPFAEGIEFQTYREIGSKKNPMPALGTTIQVMLVGGHEDIGAYRYDDFGRGDTAFTVDLSGKIIKGKALDFKKKGYFGVRANMFYDKTQRLPHLSEDPNRVDVRANLWLDNTGPIVVSHFVSFAEDEDNAFFATIVRRPQQVFMLPNDPAILRAIRISVSANKITEASKNVIDLG